MKIPTQKQLEDFLKWVDEKTYWKEDNDIPNHIIVTEYLRILENRKLKKHKDKLATV